MLLIGCASSPAHGVFQRTCPDATALHDVLTGPRPSASKAAKLAIFMKISKGRSSTTQHNEELSENVS
jgi:hypothetical protein